MTADSDGRITETPVKSLRRLCRVVTRSGSSYLIAESNVDEFYVCIDNVPNPRSVALRPVFWWRVERPYPWPPVIGQSQVMVALLRYAMEDADRMPGGGKITSAVMSVEQMTWPAEL